MRKSHKGPLQAVEYIESREHWTIESEKHWNSVTVANGKAGITIKTFDTLILYFVNIC